MSRVLAYTHIIGGFDLHLVNWEGTYFFLRKFNAQPHQS